MANALIGYTGFVGSNLMRQTDFDDYYNSKNIETIAGKCYDLLVCSAAPAEKWKANRDPEADIQSINRLTTNLRNVSAKKVILISTVDVYPLAQGVDENTVIETERCQPYGKHRFMLEKFMNNLFDTLVVRLPGLFGNGLKKNIIFDFLYNNCLDQIHADSVYQFYHLDNLWHDIQVALKNELKLINFATEPTSVREVAWVAFNIDFSNRPSNCPAYYDFHSRYAELFGGSNGYLYNKQQVLNALNTYVQSQGWKSEYNKPE